MSDNPTVSQQYAFSVGEDGDTDGIEPSEESVETDLEAFGANVDHRERDTRIDQPEASSFGVDDRKSVQRRDSGEQRALFADTEDDQRTLTGEHAASQCLFENENNTSNNDHISEPTANMDETPQMLADGGHVEDSESATQDDDSDTFDPHQHVPDEIDYITADGIEQVHEHLNDENAAIYAASSVEEQAAFLWKMVDQDVIDLSLSSR
ncbi:hypothetical protein [Halococcus thailandensis]|uniref:hypothetical protein n=1 Tax=Halococcus thailandensis TaxID=335952 RepID=UPI000AE8CB18|nr:hypothetical protein [Halococcus thailandensis]